MAPAHDPTAPENCCAPGPDCACCASATPQVEGKSVEEVASYREALFSRGPLMLSEWERIEKKIVEGACCTQRPACAAAHGLGTSTTCPSPLPILALAPTPPCRPPPPARARAGEKKLAVREEMQEALRNKVAKYDNAWQQLSLRYGTSRGKVFNEEEDRFLLCTTNKLGYGQVRSTEPAPNDPREAARGAHRRWLVADSPPHVPPCLSSAACRLLQWDELKREIRRSQEFRFDWLFKSRTPQELSRRVDLLIRLVMNEGKEGGQAGRGVAAKRAADGGAGSAAQPAAGGVVKEQSEGGAATARTVAA